MNDKTDMRTLIDIAGGGSRSSYEADEHQWMLEQIALLKAGKLDAVDRENLVQYLTEMTIRDRRELGNHFVRLLQHLLKYQVQPGRASRSWALTVLEQQRQIIALLTSTPSLKNYQDKLYAEAYPHAVRAAATETGVARSRFPAQCPWTIEQALAFEPPARR
jgi:hypothetical protein